MFNYKITFKKSHFFPLYITCFVIGVILGNWFNADPFWLYLFFLFFITTSLLFTKNIIKIILLSFCFILFGIWRYQVSLFIPTQNDISFYNNKKITFIGTVDDEPETRIDGVKLIIKSNFLKEENKLINGRVLVNNILFPEFFYGDELEIKCKLKKPTAFKGFSYDKYLAQYNIYSTCYYPEIKLIKQNQGNKFFSLIYKFKNNLKTNIRQSLPEPHASLVSAMVLGDKRGIEQKWLDKFSQTGISHIIAVSGSNISILAVILFYLAIILGLYKDKAFYLVISGISLYIIIIGLSASAVRAGIMVFLALLAFKLGRLNKSFNAIALAAGVMLLVNPKIIYDVGFQLSFLAIIGIIYLFPFLERKTERLPNLWGIKKLFLITISAQITTFPIIFYNFGTISAVAPLANILIVPITPFIMIGGIIIMIIGMFWLGLAKMVGFVILVATSYLFVIVEFLAKISS